MKLLELGKLTLKVRETLFLGLSPEWHRRRKLPEQGHSTFSFIFLTEDAM